MAERRPDWDEYFAGVAMAIGRRGDCLRAQVGCVLVSPGHRIVSSGYNGPPPGEHGCTRGAVFCPRGVDSSVSKDRCPALHAEQNAVAYAGREAAGGSAYVTKPPCPTCLRLLLAAGIVRVIVVDPTIADGRWFRVYDQPSPATQFEPVGE